MHLTPQTVNGRFACFHVVGIPCKHSAGLGLLCKLCSLTWRETTVNFRSSLVSVRDLFRWLTVACWFKQISFIPSSSSWWCCSWPSCCWTSEVSRWLSHFILSSSDVQWLLHDVTVLGGEEAVREGDRCDAPLALTDSMCFCMGVKVSSINVLKSSGRLAL